jgi:hypothetical protein
MYIATIWDEGKGVAKWKVDKRKEVRDTTGPWKKYVSLSGVSKKAEFDICPPPFSILSSLPDKTLAWLPRQLGSTLLNIRSMLSWRTICIYKKHILSLYDDEQCPGDESMLYGRYRVKGNALLCFFSIKLSKLQHMYVMARLVSTQVGFVNVRPLPKSFQTPHRKSS